jgi:hypothetical protein
MRSRLFPTICGRGGCLSRRGFGCGTLGAQRSVRMRATAASALGTVRRDGGAGAFGGPAADGCADDLGEAIDAKLFIAGVAFGADFDALDERAMIVLAQLRPVGRRRVGWVKLKFLIERQHVLLFCR